MPLSNKIHLSHKTSRKWTRIGRKNKWLKLNDGCSNKKPDIKIESVVKEYLEEIKDDN